MLVMGQRENWDPGKTSSFDPRLLLQRTHQFSAFRCYSRDGGGGEMQECPVNWRVPRAYVSSDDEADQ